MYSYNAFFDEGVLITRFYGEYIADEGDKSLLAISKSMEVCERYAIKTVIWDLRDVTAMTMINTDVARVVYFEKELLKIFQHPGKDAAEHLGAIKIYYVEPRNSSVGDLFRERLARVSNTARKTPLPDGNEPRNLSELLESLDLLELLPILKQHRHRKAL